MEPEGDLDAFSKRNGFEMKRLRLIVGLLIVLLIASCTPLVGLPVTTGPTSTEAPSIAETNTPATTETPAEVTNCAYAWTQRELPELTDEVNAAFQMAGYSEVDALANAYGENCINPQTNKVVRFSAMQTDFMISVAIEDTDDAEVMGEWIERVLKVLGDFQPGDIPGPNPGYIGISFGTSGDLVSLWFQRKEAEDLLMKGVTGSRLFEALR